MQNAAAETPPSPVIADPAVLPGESAGTVIWPADLEPWLWLAGSLVVAIVLGLIAHLVLFHVLRRIARHSAPADAEPPRRSLLDSFITRLIGPSRLAFPILGTQFVLATADAALASPLLTAASRFNTLALILTVTWAAVRAVGFLEHMVRGERLSRESNIEARRLHTQVTVLARTAAILLWIVGLAAALMTFPQVRQVGTSLLASAGIAGIIAGIAARPIAENLLAGIQIAFTEPVKLDDVVVIEGQWGTIEEISPTYIVLRIWDDRRLIIPLSYFITKPIENWTRSSSQILATVKFFTDYTVPVQRLRDELKRILDGSPLWDKRVWALQVTDTMTDTLEVRALMSAGDGPRAFDLRCEVREKLVDFIKKEYPNALPRTRMVVEARGGGFPPAPAPPPAAPPTPTPGAEPKPLPGPA